jgi:hypothetical protein
MTGIFNFKDRSFTKDEEPIETKKRGIVTGAHDLSQVESMIQRYLELADSALKPEKKDSDNPQKIA